MPYPPGGASDIAGRLQAEILSTGLGVPVVVDNRAGAGGTVGSAHVAQSAPDGYTLVMASPSSHLGAPLLFRNAGYQGVDDFTAIATFATGTALVFPVGLVNTSADYANALAPAAPARPRRGWKAHGPAFNQLRQAAVF